ncbi:MAG: NAD(P)H-hydrate dehydratase [Caldisericia bacterium]|jgi:NAD(P)H-hydrate epimerase|nr:NAD(P)H-hydrate dehydratase [Caldisericia bacterium]
MKVVDTEKIKELDKKAEEEFGISSQVLMENASLSVVASLLKEFSCLKGKHFLIFCGIGNNGGDGFAIGRKIHSLGGDVKFILLGDESKLSFDAKLNFERVKKIKIPILSNPQIEIIKKELDDSEIVIDAIFGTGLKREIEGYIKEVIQLINNSNKFVLSVDIPSGINGDNGIEMGISVNAQIVVTFGLPKIGNLIEDGAEKTKKLYLSYISYPKALYENVNSSIFLNEPLKIKDRKKNTHKKDFGDTLFISGSKKYFGAPFFSSYSFLKSGGGYSRLATVEDVIKSVSLNAREVIFYTLKENRDGTMSKENEEFLIKLSDEVKFVVLGPGIGINEDLEELIKNLIKKIKKPVLIDGDGLTLLSKNKDLLKDREAPTILTPHLGEFSKLTEIPKDEIRKEKIKILKDFSSQFKSYVVLKGYHSLISTPDGKIFINLTGNPCMATAGMGDILDGIIPAMYGLGFNIEESVRMGVFVHGFCGDLIKEKFGENGVVATQMIEYLPLALKEIKENFEEIKKRYSIEVVL